MKKNEPLKNIMTKDPVSVHTKQNPSEVRALLSEGKFHHVPVVSGKKLVGIISSTDLMRVSFSNYMGDARAVDAWLDHEYSIETLMQSEVLTLHANDSVRDAAQLLTKHAFHSIPIVSKEDGTLEGIVTSADLITYLLDQY